jgi:leukotriene-A4 hydrolase
MNKYITVLVLYFTFFLPPVNVMAVGKVVNDSIIKDDHSFADPDKAITKHLNLTLKVDFDNKQITGRASWTIENKNNSNEIIFDVNGLNIQRITIGENETTTSYFLDKPLPLLGSALHVHILPNTKNVKIYYTTAKDAIALQWLTPEQTTDKKKAYLFTQSYSIWARSWIPCQDMPGIRFTYTATVTVPKGLMAAMSAEGTRKKEPNGIYHFKQANPIPSYLMALAVGDIQFAAIDSRTGVYAEPSLLNKAVREFADMGKMVKTAELLYGKYRWQRFDVLIAPPSFTLGGMENPNLVFLTPGLLAGDRSLVSVVAHELAHSWSGNLVTNSTWNDFWLNEGVTTYFEHRIGEVLYGKDEADMQGVISRTRLKNIVVALGDTSKDTHLKLNLTGRNPDDALTDIPYDKGYAFLQTIEQAVGRRTFDAFLKRYFNKHAFQSHTTEQFLEAVNTELFNNDTSLINKVRETEWVYTGGIPTNIPIVTAAKFNAVDTLIAHFRDIGKMAELNKKIVSYNEQFYFLNHLPANLTNTEMVELDSRFHFTNAGNYRLLKAWLLLSIKHQYKEAYPQLEKYMFTYGSASYSLYKQLIKTPEGKEWAKKIFQKARSSYHPLTASKIEDLLK